MEVFYVEVSDDKIVLFDINGEIVYWDRQEWLDDPQVTVQIANAIQLGFTHGPLYVRSLLSL